MNLFTGFLVSSLLLTSTVASISARAGNVDIEKQVTDQKFVIAVKTDDVELQELDISHLQPGDSETIVTESGKTIDLLRTEDDVEIYLEGELLDAGPLLSGQHGAGGGGQVQRVHKQVEVICDAAEECDEMVWISADGTAGLHQLQHAGEGEHEEEKVYIIKKKVITD